MPYAYGAKIEHEFDGAKLNIWLTFRHPMDQDVKPAHNLWTLTVDDVEKAISSSAWQDEFTLLLASDEVVAYPDRVLLAYDGPDSNLQTTWGKDWEPWGDTLSTDIGKGKCYVDRGDPANYDFEGNDFTDDDNWHDLDLSSIVPEHTKGVAITWRMRSAAINKWIRFRTKGNANLLNTSICTTQVANQTITVDGIVAVDTDRFIQYQLTAGNYSILRLLIKGWWF